MIESGLVRTGADGGGAGDARQAHTVWAEFQQQRTSKESQIDYKYIYIISYYQSHP
jgi:hypothetical protein